MKIADKNTILLVPISLMNTIIVYVLVEYEIQLDRILGERTDVHDSLIKKETIASNLEHDKKKLQDDLKRVIIGND